LFDRIANNLERIKGLEPSELELLISRCCAIKARIVERDERENGLRRNLNFGHTVGHALEAVTNYRVFLHGEAVAYGMSAASRIAEGMGLLAASDRQRINEVITRVGKLPKSNSLAFGDIISAMHRDKKVEAGRAAFVLPVRIGEVVIRSDVPPKVVRQALKQTLA
jgi:3-dehydroquinate synthase